MARKPKHDKPTHDAETRPVAPPDELDLEAVPREELPALLAEAKAAGDESLVARILARCST